MAKLNLANGTSSTLNWDKINRFDSSENSVAKFVFEKAGTQHSRPAVVEAVLYKYPDYETRTVICCSTQSGCPMGCRFCGAGDYFVRSLSADEIVDQVKHAIAETNTQHQRIQKLQIMFMSMGEPALNQANVVTAIRNLNDLYPQARLLLSTSAPDVSFKQIIEVSKEINKVGLQFSVHESSNASRNALIPFKKKMNLEQIVQTGTEWFHATGRKPFFNYCAHDKNSSEADASSIHSFFDPNIWEATISVICERNEGLPTRNDHQLKLALEFSNKLLSRGFNTRVFDPAGQDDIGGGCGQLWYVQEKMKSPLLEAVARPSVGHGKPIVHTPGIKLGEAN
jgi:23S rRNA (adenine2503-C2)-methyltransferase